MRFERNPGASHADIADALRELAQTVGRQAMPAVLLAQWRISNGFLGDNVMFYSTSEIAERNETLEVCQYCPGFVAFANDGGSRVALLECSESATEVLLNYMGDMKGDAMEPTGLALPEWIAKGCPFSLEQPPRFSGIEMVHLQLDVLPPEGMRGLIAINKLLSLDLPLHKLRSIGDNLPYTLARMPYARAVHMAGQINRTSQCVSIWRDSDPREEMPLDY